MNNTIYALSSGHGKSGVAVLRVSGRNLEQLFRDLTGRIGEIKIRHAYFANILDRDGELVDRAIAIYFRAPFSFTGEDIIEIHCHGADAVIKKLFDVLQSYGCRMACPGEFTRRAFDNGKMDLVEVDGLATLLAARTDKQRMHALRSVAGADSDVYMRWRTDMIELAGLTSAMIDYPEDDLPPDIADKIKSKTEKLYGELTTAINGANRARAITSGFNIAIVGNVNAGKSSLFNRIVGDARAIVSDVPGTTRDVVHSEIDLDGYLVRISDTAGLRTTDDYVEMIGIERTHKQIETADLIIHVHSADCDTICDEPREPSANKIVVINKSDLVNNSDIRNQNSAILVSAMTGDGIDTLRNEIRRRVHDMLDAAESDIAINSRIHGQLIDAINELQSARETTNPDFIAEHIRGAADSIGRVLGTIDVEEVADAIFGQLCLGK